MTQEDSWEVQRLLSEQIDGEFSDPGTMVGGKRNTTHHVAALTPVGSWCKGYIQNKYLSNHHNHSWTDKFGVGGAFVRYSKHVAKYYVWSKQNTPRYTTRDRVRPEALT